MRFGFVVVSLLIFLTAIFPGCTHPASAEEFYEQGIYYNDHDNQYDKALENFNKSIGSEPGNPRVWFARSVALYNLKRYDESLESLNPQLRSIRIMVEPGL
jgi:tetratricopeptide (TPR) repeat protein